MLTSGIFATVDEIVDEIDPGRDRSRRDVRVHRGAIGKIIRDVRCRAHRRRRAARLDADRRPTADAAGNRR